MLDTCILDAQVLDDYCREREIAGTFGTTRAKRLQLLYPTKYLRLYFFLSLQGWVDFDNRLKCLKKLHRIASHCNASMAVRLLARFYRFQSSHSNHR